MGRRLLTAKNKSDALRDQLTRKLKRLNISVNRVQFRAQLYEEEMVDLVRDMAVSIDASINQRLACAVQVVEWARGAVETWRHDKEDLDAASETVFGATIGETIEAARSTSALFERLDDLVRRNVPFVDWPPDIQELSEAAAFAEVDEEAPAALEGPKAPEKG